MKAHPQRLQHWLLPALVCLLALSAVAARAQDSANSAALPDAPTARQVVPQSDIDLSGKQTKRILGIIPNFRAVSVDEKLPPQTVKEKFTGATQDSFDYSAFIFDAELAGVAQAQNSYPEFHQGVAGYARYYWHTLADQTDENYWVEFAVPAVTHQDPRYYTLGRGGIFKRTAYSFSRVLITRTDAGNETLNVSEIVGAGAASGISGLYYPSQERTWTKTGQRWVTNITVDGLTFIFKEFWPDVNSAVFHQKD